MLSEYVNKLKDVRTLKTLRGETTDGSYPRRYQAPSDRN